MLVKRGTSLAALGRGVGLPASLPISSPDRFMSLARIGAVVAAGLIVANCSAQKVASRGGVDAKYGVAASPRVVQDGEPVPKGGGREMVGKPYVVGGRLYTPREMTSYSAVGLASWYGPAFHGRKTANGEVFDRQSISVAHPTMPLPSYVRITNIANGRSIIARVNDRGPFHGNRLVDVSERVALALGFRSIGTARVKLDYVGRASTAGSDDEKLYATLRTDGTPARLRGDLTYVASAADAGGPPLTPIAEPVVTSAATQPAAGQPAAVAALPVSPSIIVGRPAPGVPLPPDRPFDLHVMHPAPLASTPGIAAGAAGPVPAAVPVPVPVPRVAMRSEPQVAGLMYAEPEVVQTFRKVDALDDLTNHQFVRLSMRGSL